MNIDDFVSPTGQPIDDADLARIKAELDRLGIDPEEEDDDEHDL